MGTAPLSKPFSQPEAPTRPYSDRRTSRRFLLPQTRREPKTLMQLILRQDWQRVLVRAKLFPHEIAQPVSIQLYDLPLRLMPLHLVCALDPPVAVVTLFLKVSPEAAKLSVRSAEYKKARTLRRSFQSLRKYRRMLSSKSLGSATSSPGLFGDAGNPPEQYPINEDREVSEQSLLHLQPSKKRALLSRWRSYTHLEPADSLTQSKAEEEEDRPHARYLDNHSSRESLSSCSIASSRQSSSYLRQDSLLDRKGVILQLSPSGGISPFPIGSQETDSTSETFSLPTKQGAVFGIQWDLTPLWESLANNVSSPDNSILAIHIATLYQASPAVLKQLLDAHPMGAVSSVLGMLPLHMFCAGWVLEPWVPPPPPLPATKLEQPLQPYHHERNPSRLKEVLSVLLQVVPESVRIRSGNHGMTPREYISEAMEECLQKQECLALLEPGELGEDGTIVEVLPTGPLDLLKELASTNPSLMFVDSCDASREVPWEIQCASSLSSQSGKQFAKSATISTLLVTQDWEGALALTEEDTQHAKEWFYGVDDRLDPTIDVMDDNDVVWKRLALHMACRYRAPVGLVEVLLDAYPPAATSPDPNSGELPIHIACQHKASYRVVKSLLARAPTSTKAIDKRGRLPLHYAVLAKAHYAVVELLVETDPSALIAPDENEKNPLDLAKQAYGRRNVVVRLLEMVTLVLEKSAASSNPVSLIKKKKKEQDTVCF